MKRFFYILLAALLLLTLAACSKAPEADPADEAPDWQAKYDLGVRYLSEGKYEEAILAFTAAIEIDPKRAEAFLGRGDTYEKLVDLERAAADYRVALELEPNADAEIKLKKWEAELLSAQLQDELWPMVRDLVLPMTVDSVVLGKPNNSSAISAASPTCNAPSATKPGWFIQMSQTAPPTGAANRNPNSFSS